MAEHTVIVMGAGVSVSEAVHFRPSRDRDHPPLDATFFRRAQRHAPQNLLDRVASQAARVGQRNLFSDDPPISLEQHLGRLYFDLQNTGSTASRTAYFDLLRLYRRELLQTTNWMIGRPGAMKRLLVEELRRSNRLSVLTFNHDLLVENALSLLPGNRNPGAWCMWHAYAIGTPDYIWNEQTRFDPDCPGDTDKHVPLLKLHGSVNWVFRTRESDPPRDLTRRRRRLFVWNNRTLPEQSDVRLHSTGRGRDWYLWPLIVPPIYEKHGLIRYELERVWQQAGEQIAQADRVIFWGYSFPRADLHARYFFDSAANENDALRRPILINPDPDSERELWSVLRPRSVRHYRHIGEHLALEYG